jgi:hypothetical protein
MRPRRPIGTSIVALLLAACAGGGAQPPASAKSSATRKAVAVPQPERKSEPVAPETTPPSQSGMSVGLDPACVERCNNSRKCSLELHRNNQRQRARIEAVDCVAECADPHSAVAKRVLESPCSRSSSCEAMAECALANFRIEKPTAVALGMAGAAAIGYVLIKGYLGLLLDAESAGYNDKMKKRSAKP